MQSGKIIIIGLQSTGMMSFSQICLPGQISIQWAELLSLIISASLSLLLLWHHSFHVSYFNSTTLMDHALMLFSLLFLSSALLADLILPSLFVSGIERHGPLVSFRQKTKRFFFVTNASSTPHVLFLEILFLLEAGAVSRWWHYCVVSVNCQTWQAEFLHFFMYKI